MLRDTRMTVARSLRCPACASRDIAATTRSLRYPGGTQRTFPLACTSCGLLLERRENCHRALDRALRADAFEPDTAAAFGLDLYTLRTAATRFARRAVPADAAQALALQAPHAELAARARLIDLGSMPGEPVSLGLLCRAGETDAVLSDLRLHASWAGEIMVLASGPAAAPRPVEVEGFASGAVRLAQRPLAGDFAAQRNALQALARHRWMLQLDADETLSAQALALLPALARMADEDGAVSVGLARRNLVDGVLSDVYPDVQYRLNRSDIRYEGKVHERPARPWQRSFISLHGAIDHHLPADHVRTRSTRYEALDPGRGRLEEAQALLRPYRD